MNIPLLAYHEIGHALVAAHYGIPSKVEIIEEESGWRAAQTTYPPIDIPRGAYIHRLLGGILGEIVYEAKFMRNGKLPKEGLHRWFEMDCDSHAASDICALAQIEGTNVKDISLNRYFDNAQDLVENIMFSKPMLERFHNYASKLEAMQNINIVVQGGVISAH